MIDSVSGHSAHIGPPVLAAVDGSPSSHRAVVWAATEALLHGCGLHLVNSWVLPPESSPGTIVTEGDPKRLHDEGEHILSEAAQLARACAPGDELVITTEAIDTLITPTLVERSRAARMLVVGSRGLGAFRRGLLGSVSTAVAQHAHCPVAVIHADAPLDAAAAATRPVLVGVDGSGNSAVAVELAFDAAARRNVGLMAVHAWSDTSGLDLPARNWDSAQETARATLAENLAGYAEKYPDVPVQRVVTADRPVRSLLDASADAQLVVVGSHGRGGFAGMLLGSTSNALLHAVDIPIVIVRSRNGR